MKIGSLVWISLVIFGTIFCGASEEDFPILRGDYLGQKKPGMKPVIFAPGIVSTRKYEFNAAFSPAGDEFYYSVNESGRETMMFMQRIKNIWQSPQRAPFVSPKNDCDPIFSFDGNRIYFISTRTRQNGASDWDIYYVSRTGDGWSAPVNLGPPINTEYDEYYVSFTSSGTLYFATDKPGGLGSHDIYRARLVEGVYAAPENLGSSINTQHLEHDPFIAPDESYLLFTSVDRKQGFGSGDLYVSFQRADGTWTEAKNLGQDFNSKGYDFCPIISWDGKYFFFTKNSDIYWVSIEAILKLR